MTKYNFRPFFISIVLPSFITIILFIVVMFSVILPHYERAIMDRKKEMISELTNTAWSLIAEYHQEFITGNMSLEEAQEMAAIKVGEMRYGSDSKDYFWIIDTTPKMIMHPYRVDFIGQALNDYSDPEGTLLFVEAVRVTRDNHTGFIDYLWQWKDNPDLIVAKLSFVRKFDPWAWIVGTGIYLEDVKEEIKNLKTGLVKISVLISLVITLLLLFIVRQSLSIEKKRQSSERKLRLSRQKYQNLVKASVDGTIMVINDKILFSNQKFNEITAYSALEVMNQSISLFIDQSYGELLAKISPGRSLNFETSLITKKSQEIDVLVSASVIKYGTEEGIILVFKILNKQEKYASKIKKISKNIELDLALEHHALENQLLNRINQCKDIIQLKDESQKVPYYTDILISSGLEAKTVSEFLSTCSDALTSQCIRINLKDWPVKPGDFCFMAMGSEGRAEQSLNTDQDNAIIYQSKKESEDSQCRNFYLELGKKINDDLNVLGYAYCKGDVMAGNPLWTMSLEAWKLKFKQWIYESGPKDLMQASIFFDLRPVFGQISYGEELQNEIFKLTKNQAAFFLHLADNIIKFKVPGSLHESDEEIDVKRLQIIITGFARLYCLKHRLPGINTWDRLNALESSQIISNSLYKELIYAYEYLMKMRLSAQVHEQRNVEPLSNIASLENLSTFDRQIFKMIFDLLTDLKTKLNFDFKGGLGQNLI